MTVERMLKGTEKELRRTLEANRNEFEETRKKLVKVQKDSFNPVPTFIPHYFSFTSTALCPVIL